MSQKQPVTPSDSSSESITSSASTSTASAATNAKQASSKVKTLGFRPSLFYFLFAISVVVNCAYVTGCCSFHLRTSDECGDHSCRDSISEDTEMKLRKIAGKLKIQVPSDAGAEQVEALLLSALSQKDSFERGRLTSDVLESLRKAARDLSAEDDFDALCRFIEKVNGKTILILNP